MVDNSLFVITLFIDLKALINIFGSKVLFLFFIHLYKIETIISIAKIVACITNIKPLFIIKC